MTIVISVLTSDGIVLAADSRQVVQSATGQWRIDSDYTCKIFRLNSHVGVAIVGQGTFYSDRETSPHSIRSIIHRAAKELPQDCSVNIAASALHSKASHALQIHQTTLTIEKGGLAFYVGGYNSQDAESGELYHCEIPGDISLERTTEDAGLVWGGQREIVDRLILGYDPRLCQLLPDNSGKEILNKLRPKIQLLINFQTMPLQDAVDLANMLVHSTVEMQRLSDGIVGMPGYFAGCGGSVDIAVITPNDGFQWLRQKSLRDRIS
jgi:20S proteasome alpha/beta subunit